jgi:hypothetical protein
MPHEYRPKQKAFYSNGRKVSRMAVRDEIDQLTEYTSKQAASIAKKYQAGKITIAQFELQMRDLLKSAHIISASVGKGGRARMTQRDWGRVGAKIKWQYRYLERFAKKVARGGISEAAIASRSRSYASAIYISFARTFKESQTEFVQDGKNPARVRLITNSKEGCRECADDEARGWVSVDDLKLLGERLCGDFCRCDLEFEDD